MYNKKYKEAYLAHYNHHHDALGRFARGNGTSRDAKLISIGRNIDKIDKKTSSLKKKESKYRVKASKYQRKSNKVKRLASNPLIGLTDASRGANYAALRYEGKGYKYVNKADRLNRKISKLDKKRTDLRREQIEMFIEDGSLRLYGPLGTVDEKSAQAVRKIKK